MAKSTGPKSGPIGNTVNSRRGRGISGRPSANKPQSPGSEPGGTGGRSKDDPDTDGYSVGGRGK